MSTLKLENIKHENSSTNNMVMNSDGSVSTTGNASVGGTLGVTGVTTMSNNLGINSTPTAALDVRRTDANGKIAEFHQSSGYGLEIHSSQSRALIGSGYLQDLVIDTDAGSGGVERMRISKDGRVTKPSQPHLLAMGYKERYGTTDRHLFKTITTNTGNHWNNVNGKFTCPVDGNYLVTAFSGYKESTTHAGIGIGYNGSVLSYGWSLSSDRHTQQSCTIIKSASANDYFYYYAHTSYTTPIASAGNDHHSHFSIYLLG